MLQKEAETGIVGLAKAEAAASDIRVEKAESESRERLQAEGILPPPSESGERADNYSTTTFEKDDVARMDSEQVEKEKKDVQEMIEELKQKLDDYAASATAGGGGGGSSSNVNASSSGANMSAKEKVQMAINEVLLGSSTNALGAPPPLNPNAPVNDLSAMVKKKKKLPPVEEAVSTKQQHGKRKAEDDVVEVPSQDENSKKQKAK